ncbi:MAG: hypothetical protein AAF806_24255 [Bacteroidota bacterium]
MPIKQVSSKLLRQIVNNILSDQGLSKKTLRQTIYDKLKNIVRKNEAVPLKDKTLENYINKLALHPYKITDIDVQQLQMAGYSQAQIFELTAVAAVSAGKTRLDIVLELLKRQQS